MYSEVIGATVFGLEANLVKVEIDTGPGLPCFEMSGFLNKEVKEAKERTRVAIKNSGYDIRPQRIVMNFFPADLKKHGTGLDLAIGIALLAANSYINNKDITSYIFIGELRFDGSVKGVKGSVSCLLEARKLGVKKAVISSDNEAECAFVDGIKIYVVTCIKEVVEHFRGVESMKVLERKADDKTSKEDFTKDFQDIRGQNFAKRATLIAAAGMHNILYIGPPGSGKSMLAARIPTIFPNLTYEEKLSLTNIYSIAGLLSKGEIINTRPFRSPGQNVTETAMLGGGAIPKAGEVTLASKGVLYLDELTQFNMKIVEALRQPLEDKKVTISKSHYSLSYPADFMLVASMNPCKCGYYPDRKKCFCSDIDIKRYLGRLSKPLIDRFDMCIRTSSLAFADLESKEEGMDKDILTSASMKKMVEEAVYIQKERFRGKEIVFNSAMKSKDVIKYCQLGGEEKGYMETIFESKSLTARGYHKILKLSRTIADLAGREKIAIKDLSQAISFRNSFGEDFFSKEIL